MMVFETAPKYDFKLRGQQFVIRTSLGLILLAIVYVASHTILKPESLLPRKEDIFTFLGPDNAGTQSECRTQADRCDDEFKNYNTGVLVINDEGNAVFYLGRVAIELFTEKVYQRNQAIENLVQTSQANLIRWLGELRRIVGNAKQGDRFILDALLDAIDSGQYQEAILVWRKVIRIASPSSLDGLDALPETTLTALMQLRQLKREQIQVYEGLAPPRLAKVFWITTNLAIAEVIFWSLAGVLTNLLINSSKYLTEGSFRPIEKYVGYTKMVYGPMVSVVIVLAILVGWIDVGSYETVSWSLPVLGFLFGYNSRKASMLVDRLSERIIGATRKSIDEGPEQVAKKRIENLRGIMWQSRSPATFAELIRDAKIVAEGIVSATVKNNEAAS